MDIDLIAIGIRIKERRKELHLTQNEIKQSVGISSGNLSDIENGNRAPAIGTLYKLSVILKCSIDWIVTGNDSEFPSIGISDQGEIELLNGFRLLSKDNQEELIDILHIKLQRSVHHPGDKNKLSNSANPNTADSNVS